MRIEQLKEILLTWKKYSFQYQQKLAKEFFIKKALEFIYKHSLYPQLTFNGWTCLRMLYQLPRLSEDIDLDVFPDISFDMDIFAKEITSYFKKNTGKDAGFSIKSEGKTLLIKLPMLHELGLVTSKSESDVLYIKCDIQSVDGVGAQTQVSPYTKDGYFFLIRHYDLPTLFANKLRAVFDRWDKLYHDKFSFKWRDFFDLIRYLQQWVLPNFDVIQYFLKKELWISVKTIQEVFALLDKRIAKIDTKGIYEDIVDLVEDSVTANQFADHFVEIYKDLRGKLLQKN